MPLLRAEGCEDEAQIGLVLPEDVRSSEAEPVILPRTPNEPLVVDIARGLDRGSMIEQAHRVLMHAAYCVGYHWEEGNVKGFVWSCVFAILSGGLLLQDLTPKWAADLGVRVLPSYIDDELAAANDAREVTVFRKLDVDVALFPLGASLPGADRLVRGDVALVGGGGDAREVAQDAVKLVLKLIMQRDEVATAPAGARGAMVSMGVELLAAAPYLTTFLLHVIRLSGGEAKGRGH